MKGTIKTLTDRGFGFISREGEAKDLFFHSKDLNGVTLKNSERAMQSPLMLFRVRRDLPRRMLCARKFTNKTAAQMRGGFCLCAGFLET